MRLTAAGLGELGTLEKLLPGHYRLDSVSGHLAWWSPIVGRGVPWPPARRGPDDACCCI